MSKINNVPSKTNDDMVNQVRKAIEHRATWMGNMCLEAKEAGADWEAIARKAIKKTGLYHGANIEQAMDGEEGIKNFTKAFLPELTQGLFEMDLKEVSDEKLFVEFNYCPLVTAWQKLNMDDDMIKTLCDIAMDGDRGIAEKAGFDFELGKTIAKGDSICEVCFKSRK